MNRFFELEGRSAFVAGAYGDLGAAIARALVSAGVRVAIAGRDAQKLAALEHALGGNSHPVGMDASDVDSIRDAVADAASKLGTIDFLVNCVGIFEEERLLEATPASFDRVTTVNYRAAMFLSQAVARVQVDRGTRGRQVHLLSVRSQLGMPGRGYSSYCGSKGGLAMLVRQHAVELAPHGITVNGVAPTVVRTVMAEHWFADPVRREKLLSRIPLGRVAEVDDVAGCTLFFLAPAASFVTGQVLYVDGGVTVSQ
ncbi:MAG TPA: SDR family oxidoreductase [Casimicrobiaceae bacterium]|nr:SDR family oxidoreductase [Casimicrobiaceae bacterium]